LLVRVAISTHCRDRWRPAGGIANTYAHRLAASACTHKHRIGDP
jgi:hypothetical protein